MDLKFLTLDTFDSFTNLPLAIESKQSYITDSSVKGYLDFIESLPVNQRHVLLRREDFSSKLLEIYHNIKYLRKQDIFLASEIISQFVYKYNLMKNIMIVLTNGSSIDFYRFLVHFNQNLLEIPVSFFDGFQWHYSDSTNKNKSYVFIHLDDWRLSGSQELELASKVKYSKLNVSKFINCVIASTNANLELRDINIFSVFSIIDKIACNDNFTKLVFSDLQIPDNVPNYISHTNLNGCMNSMFYNNGLPVGSNTRMLNFCDWI